MRKNNEIYSASDTVIMTGIICVFLFMFRLWPLIAIVLIIGFFVMVKQIIARLKPQVNAPKEKQSLVEESPVETDYEHIKKSISFYVNDVYPEAKWIWESANSKQQIETGEDVYIRLNKTGEYRRVKVLMRNKQVVGIEIAACENAEKIETSTSEKVQVDNSESVAFEWVDSHIAELNERCNEVIGQGKDELILNIGDLPQEKYWEHIRDELLKAGLKNVELLPSEGIKIKFK